MRSRGEIDKPAYTEYLDESLTGSRIGVLRDLFRKGRQFEPANKVIEQEMQLCKSARQLLSMA